MGFRTEQGHSIFKLSESRRTEHGGRGGRGISCLDTPKS